MSFFDVLGSDTQREHAFQKKIPGEKKAKKLINSMIFTCFQKTQKLTLQKHLFLRQKTPKRQT